MADAIHDEFVDALAAETRRIELGHEIEPGVAYGPVLHEGVRARTCSHVEDALRRGGTLVVGGAAPRGTAYERGFFFEPSLIDGAADGAAPHLVAFIVGRLAKRLEGMTEFDDIAIAILPIVEGGEIVADGLEISQAILA